MNNGGNGNGYYPCFGKGKYVNRTFRLRSVDFVKVAVKVKEGTLKDFKIFEALLLECMEPEFVRATSSEDCLSVSALKEYSRFILPK